MIQLWKIKGVLLLSWSLVACQGAMETQYQQAHQLCGSQSMCMPPDYERIEDESQGILTKAEKDVRQAEETMEEADLALEEAEKVIASMLDKNGNFKIFNQETDILAQASDEIEAQFFLGGALKKTLDKALAKVEGVVSHARHSINEARRQIAHSIAQLDPSDPQHARMIHQLTEMLKRLDQADAYISFALEQLLAKMDWAMGQLEKFLSQLNPIARLAVEVLILDLKSALYEFRHRLSSLI